jgi:D-amino peptidase
MAGAFERILILADIEGSSGCWSYRASSFLTPEWARACLDMTRDVAVVVTALLNAGVRRIVVKDFHRTAYNLLAECIDPRARVVSGYRRGAVPGIGSAGGFQAAMFVGMHAAAGTDGFLAHTLTSRLSRLEVNGRPLPEISLFAAALAPFDIRPVFFSGCPVACRQAAQILPAIRTYAIDKSQDFAAFDTAQWRTGLAQSAVSALHNHDVGAHRPEGPFQVFISARDGKRAALKMARRWGFAAENSSIVFQAPDIHTLYLQLIRLCYLTPALEKFLPLTLPLFNLKGRLGLAWVRRRLRREGLLDPHQASRVALP